VNPARTAAQLRLAALWRWPSDRANLALSSTPLRGHACQPRGGTAGIRIAGVRELRNGACFNPVVAVATAGRLQPLLRGRPPWPVLHPDPAGRAGRPHASGARAGPAADGYGSAAPCVISLRETVRIRAAMARHPKVAAGWSFSGRRSVTRRCYRSGGGTVAGNQAQLPGRATALVRLAARRAAIPTRTPAGLAAAYTPCTNLERASCP
jgi:hypothetical protein